MQYVYPAVPDVCIRPIDKLFLWKKKKLTKFSPLGKIHYDRRLLQVLMNGAYVHP